MGTAKTVWDPLRRKNVALTPEEDVRQWFIMQLNRLMKVPLHMMMSEVALSIGGKRLRADIVVYGRDASPAAVVECKRPDVQLDNSVLDQTVRYNMVLNVRFIFITNGTKTFVCRRADEGSGPVRYEFLDRFPSYGEMTGQAGPVSGHKED